MESKKSVNVVSSIMVRPSEETPRGTLWLSRVDMLQRHPYSHTNALYVYKPLLVSSTLASKTFFDASILKKTLSRALVPFYPMAGRLNKKDGRYEIDCNAKGALFKEAETTYEISDLNDPKSDLNKKELFPYCDSKELSTIPLLMVQLTRFKCGGVCLGFSQHHHVADGSSHVHFINSWGRLARGLDIEVLPVHDRFAYLAPRDPPQLEFLDSTYLEPPLPPLDLPDTIKNNTSEVTFKLSKSQIDSLMQKVMSSQEMSNHKLTTFTVLAGHVWRSACKARQLSDDNDVNLYILTSGRSTLKLPLGYCGNAILSAGSKDKAGIIIHKPLWYVARKVCDAISKMKDPKCFRSAIDFIESQPNLEPLIRGGHHYTCPNLLINSWTKMPFNELDFGWGAPKFMRTGGVRYEGQSVFTPNYDEDGSLLFSIRLFSAHMALFEKYFYEFDK